MKTIEERAKIYADGQCRCYKCDGIDDFTLQPCKNSLNNGCQEHYWKKLGYIQGAKEQKIITTDNMIKRCKRVLSGQRLELIDKACKWLQLRSEYPFTDEIISGFIKFMMEE